MSETERDWLEGNDARTQYEREREFHHEGEDSCLPGACRVCDGMRADAYQAGYDAGCDDPDSVWTSTIQAACVEVLAPVWALVARYEDSPWPRDATLHGFAKRLREVLPADTEPGVDL